MDKQRSVPVRGHMNKHGTYTRPHQRTLNTSPASGEDPTGVASGVGQLVEWSRTPVVLPRQVGHVEICDHVKGPWVGGEARLGVSVSDEITPEDLYRKEYLLSVARKLNPTPSAERVAGYLADYPWDATTVREPDAVCEFTLNDWSGTKMDPRGAGQILYTQRTRQHGWVPTVLHVHPYANLSYLVFEETLDLRGANLGGANVKGSAFDDVDFTGANLEDVNASEALFLIAPGVAPELFTNSLRYANCRNADFSRAGLRFVDLTGADFTGADFTGAVLPEDLTHVDITAEQYATLDVAHRKRYKIPHVGMDELEYCLGGKDAVAVAIWAGELQVLHQETNDIVNNGTFASDEHFVPLWELRRLIRNHHSS